MPNTPPNSVPAYPPPAGEAAARARVLGRMWPCLLAFLILAWFVLAYPFTFKSLQNLVVAVTVSDGAGNVTTFRTYYNFTADGFRVTLRERLWVEPIGDGKPVSLPNMTGLKVVKITPVTLPFDFIHDVDATRAEAALRAAPNAVSRPNWYGIAFLSTFSVLAMWTGWTFIRWLEFRALAAGTCPHCGYDLEGLPGSAVCPECGGVRA